jgi:hypothetical protein
LQGGVSPHIDGTVSSEHSKSLFEWSVASMSTQTPLAPKLTDNVTVHIVLNDFGTLGRAFLETDELEADEWTTVTNIINGEYSNPVRVVAFNIAEGWSRDVTENIAEAVLERGDTEGHLSEPAKKFVECVLGAVDQT